MKYVVYAVMVIVGALLWFLPQEAAVAVAAFAGASLGLNIFNSEVREKFLQRDVQVAIAHGVMLIGMALEIITMGHSTNFMRALIGITAVPLIWYYGGALIALVRE